MFQINDNLVVCIFTVSTCEKYTEIAQIYAFLTEKICSQDGQMVPILLTNFNSGTWWKKDARVRPFFFLSFFLFLFWIIIVRTFPSSASSWSLLSIPLLLLILTNFVITFINDNKFWISVFWLHLICQSCIWKQANKTKPDLWSL